MRKRLMTVAAVILAALVTVPMTADAETFSGQDGWRVVFDGENLDSTFTNAQIDDTIYQMQPGDTADIHLELRNDYPGDTWWYMTNEVLRTLEDTQDVAEGGAYSYRLAYIGPEGSETILYSSEDVGGETVNESGEGLHQATDSLEDYFYLDTLSEGESGEINLQVHLEGETQGNDYQNTLAQLQMNFAVELAQEGTTPGGGSGASPVKTGDTAPVMIYALLTLLAGLILLFIAIYRITRSRREEEGNR